MGGLLKAKELKGILQSGSCFRWGLLGSGATARIRNNVLCVYNPPNLHTIHGRDDGVNLHRGQLELLKSNAW